MKALLDTNIIIHRENIKPTNYEIGLLFRWLDKLKYEKCLHACVLSELRSLRNDQIQELYDAKLSAYTELKTVGKPTEQFLQMLPIPKNRNDVVDNQLLFEVYSDRVDIFITEDKALRSKGKKLGIGNRVLSINEFISVCTSENPELIEYKVLSVRKEYFGNIDVGDTFFDSLRDSYDGFDKWFLKKNNEEAYICRSEKGTIFGFLYLKIEGPDENYRDIYPSFDRKKRLKIGTFKIVSSGFRLGERFIKIVFDNALEQHVDEIYVTLFAEKPETKALEDLLTDWGFEEYGVKKNANNAVEKVLVKKLNTYQENLTAKQNYPNLLSVGRQKFILPIYSIFHTPLLPDSQLKTENESDFIDNVAYRYALQKVYVSWAPERNINSGDIILFYRPGENPGRKKYESVLTTVGIVDHIQYNFLRKEDFMASCKNRSVFSEDELEDFWINHRNSLLVLTFIFVKSLKKRLTLEYLWNNSIVEIPSGPRPFTRISDDVFHKILLDSGTEIDFIEE